MAAISRNSYKITDQHYIALTQTQYETSTNHKRYTHEHEEEALTHGAESMIIGSGDALPHKLLMALAPASLRESPAIHSLSLIRAVSD